MLETLVVTALRTTHFTTNSLASFEGCGVILRWYSNFWLIKLHILQLLPIWIIDKSIGEESWGFGVHWRLRRQRQMNKRVQWNGLFHMESIPILLHKHLMRVQPYQMYITSNNANMQFTFAGVGLRQKDFSGALTIHGCIYIYNTSIVNYTAETSRIQSTESSCCNTWW